MNISRFVNVKNELIRCEAEFVTPSFLGGAEQNAQLRTPPFKAALRWWWRVLFGWQYGSEIYEAESKLFGSTDSASKVRIEVIGKLSAQSSNSFGGKDIQVTSKGRKFPIDVIDYLAYGLYDYSKDRHGNIYKRDHFAANSRFTLDVCMPKDKEQEIILCLKALFTFGGVGSRSRNGFGSLRLTNNALPNATYNIDLKNIEPLKYPTLSNKSMLFETKQPFGSWNDALSQIAISYRNARGALEQKHIFTTRSLLSRPIEARGENIPEYIRKNRSPKQFIMHIAKTDDNKFIGRILSLPIIFYEKDKQKKYDDMISKMHDWLKNDMDDKTDAISKLLGAAK